MFQILKVNSDVYLTSYNIDMRPRRWLKLTIDHAYKVCASVVRLMSVTLVVTMVTLLLLWRGRLMIAQQLARRLLNVHCTISVDVQHPGCNRVISGFVGVESTTLHTSDTPSRQQQQQ